MPTQCRTHRDTQTKAMPNHPPTLLMSLRVVWGQPGQPCAQRDTWNTIKPQRMHQEKDERMTHLFPTSSVVTNSLLSNAHFDDWRVICWFCCKYSCICSGTMFRLSARRFFSQTVAFSAQNFLFLGSRKGPKHSTRHSCGCKPSSRSVSAFFQKALTWFISSSSKIKIDSDIWSWL